MAVAVLAPFAFPAVRGNAVTVQRIVAGSKARLRLHFTQEEENYFSLAP
jgi:hypothetical protein